MPGQLTLSFSFRKQEHYVIAQGADLHEMRIRLIDRARGRGKVMVNEPSGPTHSYAVNLESQPAGFKPEAVQQAQDRLKVPIFLSQAEVDGVTWYRLRAGPFEKRADAERILGQALPDYPRAWLAIGDDTATTQGGGESLPAVGQMGSDPPLDAATLNKLVADARAAMNARDYPTAITILTQLQRQPEFPQRAADAGVAGARARAFGATRARQGRIPGIPAPLPQRRGVGPRRAPARHPFAPPRRRPARAPAAAARTRRAGPSREASARPIATTARASAARSPRYPRRRDRARRARPRAAARCTTTSTCWCAGAASASTCSGAPA